MTLETGVVIGLAWLGATTLGISIGLYVYKIYSKFFN